MGIFQKRHYEQIARAIARLKRPQTMLINEFSSMFFRDNPDFKLRKFIDECNFRGEVMKTFTIELRVDFEEKSAEKDEIMLNAAKVAAKHLYTAALLISGKRKPDIALHNSDMFAGSEEINLAEDLE